MTHERSELLMRAELGSVAVGEGVVALARSIGDAARRRRRARDPSAARHAAPRCAPVCRVW